MPDHIRSLLVILILATFAFRYCKSLIPEFIPVDNFNSRKKLWFIATLVAFLAHNFWIYAFILFLIVLKKLKVEPNPIALYFALLFTVPTGEATILGFGVINQLFALSHQRLLALALLLPLAIKLQRTNKDFKYSSLLSDKLLILYLGYIAFLYFRDKTFTDSLRQIVYSIMDTFLPYYVVSRYIRSMQAIREVIMTLIISILIIAVIAIFENLRGWLLYLPLNSALGVTDMTSYLGRSGMVRASATSGHSLALGLVICVSLGMYIYVKDYLIKKSTKKSLLLIIIGGLYASLARGSWIGSLFTYMCFIITGKQALQKLTMLGLVLVLSLGILSTFPAGQKIINLLPFIGNAESENVDYRTHLFQNSMIVIQRNFWTGSPNFLENPEMIEMTNGFGVIDIVNTYLGIALQSGVIGLTLYCGFFISILLSILKTLKRIPDKNSEAHVLGRALFATLCGILFILVTSSPVGIIEVLCWSFSGLICAYLHIQRKNNI